MREFKGYSTGLAMQTDGRVKGSGSSSEAVRKAQREIWMIPLAALVAMLAVAWVTKAPVAAMHASGAVHDSDTALLAWFRSIATTQMDQANVAVSFLASTPAMIAYAFGGLSVIFNRKRWLLLYAWDALFVGLAILPRTIKPIFNRARPEGAEVFLTSHSTSFPSTHAMCAIAGFGMIAFVVNRLFAREREQRALVIVAAVALTLMVGTSRLYLGVHYLSDVIAGFAVGGLWLWVCLFALRRAEEAAARDAMSGAFSSSRRNPKS
jgi:membrane-associated phospholipid phosphatase